MKRPNITFNTFTFLAHHNYIFLRFTLCCHKTPHPPLCVTSFMKGPKNISFFFAIFDFTDWINLVQNFVVQSEAFLLSVMYFGFKQTASFFLTKRRTFFQLDWIWCTFPPREICKSFSLCCSLVDKKIPQCFKAWTLVDLSVERKPNRMVIKFYEEIGKNSLKSKNIFLIYC